MRRVLALAVLLPLGLCPVPPRSSAQAPERTVRIGVLGSRPSASIAAFQEALRELGHVEGRNITFEYRWADGGIPQLRPLADEMVRLRVDLIFAPGTVAALAAKAATTEIPIVFAVVADPVGVGLVAGLSRPGANITGVTTINRELVGKRLDLLRQISPRISRIGHLFSSADPSNVAGIPIVREAARAIGFTLQSIPVREPHDVDDAFTKMRSDRTEALAVSASPLMTPHYRRIVELAARNRLPAIYATREVVEAGGLISYAASFLERHRRAAIYVDRILRGAKPADLPVEQPTRFELVINTGAARAIGLTLPQSLLLQADEVIR